MKKNIKYSKAPDDIGLAIEEGKIVKDFLPAPNMLLEKDDSVKVTLSLSKNSVDFFKKKAESSHASYQKMLRKVIDLYVDHYKQAN